MTRKEFIDILNKKKSVSLVELIFKYIEDAKIKISEELILFFTSVHLPYFWAEAATNVIQEYYISKLEINKITINQQVIKYY